MMEIGKRVQTPRFGNVKIDAVFADKALAETAGFVEPTHYWDDPQWEIYGKPTGNNRMVFGAVLKAAV